MFTGENIKSNKPDTAQNSYYEVFFFDDVYDTGKEIMPNALEDIFITTKSLSRLQELSAADTHRYFHTASFEI